MKIIIKAYDYNSASTLWKLHKTVVTTNWARARSLLKEAAAVGLTTKVILKR